MKIKKGFSKSTTKENLDQDMAEVFAQMIEEEVMGYQEVIKENEYDHSR